MIDWLSDWVLLHINYCWLFNAKFCLYKYCQYIWFANTFCQQHFQTRLSSFFFHGVNWFQVLLCINNNISQLLAHIWIDMICQISLLIISFLNELELSCLHFSITIVSTQLNDFNCCYLTVIFLFNINYLLAHSEVVTSIAIQH